MQTFKFSVGLKCLKTHNINQRKYFHTICEMCIKSISKKMTSPVGGKKGYE